jgi:hypothetical protein
MMIPIKKLKMMLNNTGFKTYRGEELDEYRSPRCCSLECLLVQNI